MNRFRIKNKRVFYTVAGSIAVLLALLIFVFLFMKEKNSLQKQKDYYESLSTTYSELSERNRDLKEDISNADDESSMEKKARENGFVNPGENIYYEIDKY
ncbi:MAG: septum formation initiator family protein [Clostridiales bacterium]|nr:septum formation initiator family protein [Clostridiales bacterium]